MAPTHKLHNQTDQRNVPTETFFCFLGDFKVDEMAIMQMRIKSNSNTILLCLRKLGILM